MINKGIKPFYGLTFLHKAKIEPNLRDKWIYAAMATELATKEFLFKKDPKLRELWDNRQAPKIKDLFEKYVAPNVTAKIKYFSLLIRNARIRNKIIHRPYKEQGLTYKNAMEYLDTVESYIFTLMLEIYPNNPVLKECIQNIKNDMTAKHQ